MKALHLLMMLAGAGVLVYSLNPRHWRPPEVNEIDSAALIQAMIRKGRKL